MQHYDMVVIGSGPSGRRAAIQSAKLGKSVLVVDKGRRLGGVSVHTGTIPSKTLRETVLNLSGWRERGFYGRGYRVKQDISIERPDPAPAQDARPRGRGAAAPVHAQRRAHMRAAAKFADANRCSSPPTTARSARSASTNALIAVGTRPHRPHNVPFDNKHVFDSDEMLALEQLPRTLTVIGGGVIGVEYATIFSALDVPVTLIEAAQHHPRLRRPRDRRRLPAPDARPRHDDQAGQHGEGDRGRQGGRVEITLADGRTVRSEILLYAAGRSGNVGSLGLDTVGIEVDSRGRIKVDPQTFQTTVPQHLCRGRRDRLPEPCLDVDGAGPGRRLPRLRRAAAAAAGDLSLRHLCGAGDFDGRPVRGAGARKRASPTRSASRASARPRAATSWASIPAS